MLIIQTWPQTPGANSYGDVVGFKAHHDLRLQSYSAYTDPQIEASLVAATEYLDMRFAYNGWKTVAEQSTEFPRNDLYNARGDLVQGVPTHVVKAAYEYAIRWLRNGFTLIPDPEQDASGRSVKATQVDVGPVSERVEYSEFSNYRLPEYPYPDGLLKSQGFVASGKSGGVMSLPMARG